MAPARSPSSAATMRTSARSSRGHDLVGQKARAPGRAAGRRPRPGRRRSPPASSRAACTRLASAERHPPGEVSTTASASGVALGRRRVTCSPRTASATPPASSTPRGEPAGLGRLAARARPRPLPDAKRSQQPRRPHGHSGPWGSTTMWPGSPAKPCAPRTSSPSAMSPPPMPVPSVTQHGVAHPAGGAGQVLAPGRAGGVVVDPDRQPEARGRARRRPGRRAGRAGSGRCAGRRRRSTSPAMPTPTAPTSRAGAVAEPAHDRPAMASSSASARRRAWAPASSTHGRGVGRVERDAEHLGAADVDAGEQPGRAGSIAEQGADAADARRGRRCRRRSRPGTTGRGPPRPRPRPRRRPRPSRSPQRRQRRPIAASRSQPRHRQPGAAKPLRHEQRVDPVLAQGLDHVGQARRRPAARRRPPRAAGRPAAASLRPLDLRPRPAAAAARTSPSAGGHRHGQPAARAARAGRGAARPRAGRPGRRARRWPGASNGCWPHTCEGDLGRVAEVLLGVGLEGVGVVAAPVALAAGVVVAGQLLEQLGALDQLAELEHEHAGPLAVGEQHADGLVLAEHRLELADRGHVVDRPRRCGPARAAR